MAYIQLENCCNFHFGVYFCFNFCDNFAKFDKFDNRNIQIFHEMRTLILTSMLILLHIKLANFATSCKHEEMGAEMVRQKEIESLRESIKQLESSGRYHVRGASGEYGAYQFMPETWRRWSVKYAGQILDIENSQNQDAVAKFKISTLVDEGYTSAQIAAFWNSGLFYGWESLVGINKHGVRYDVPGYVESVLERI